MAGRSRRRSRSRGAAGLAGVRHREGQPARGGQSGHHRSVVGAVGGRRDRGAQRRAVAAAHAHGRRRKHLAVRRPAGRRVGDQLDVRPERRDRSARRSSSTTARSTATCARCTASARRPTRRSSCSTSTSRRPPSDIAEMYFARGFAEFAAGVGFLQRHSAQRRRRRRRSVFGTAAAGEGRVRRRDRVVRHGDGTEQRTDAASVTINRAARIGKARALLGMGLEQRCRRRRRSSPAFRRRSATTSRRRSPAATTSCGPAGAARTATPSSDSVQGNARNILVKNAIPFLSAKDPRVPAHYKSPATARTP